MWIIEVKFEEPTYDKLLVLTYDKLPHQFDRFPH